MLFPAPALHEKRTRRYGEKREGERERERDTVIGSTESERQSVIYILYEAIWNFAQFASACLKIGAILCLRISYFPVSSVFIFVNLSSFLSSPRGDGWAQ